MRRRAQYLRQRKRRFIALGVALLAILLGLSMWNVFNLHLPIPAPKSDITPSLAVGDWPLLQRDHQRTAYLPGESPQLLGSIRWRLQVKGSISAPPALADETLFVGTVGSRILAVDSLGGELLWVREVPGPVDLPVTVAGDYVYAPLRSGQLVALEKTTGNIQWSFQTKDTLLAAPLVYQGVVYLPARDRLLYALDAFTGETRWVYKLRAVTLSSPATSDNILALGTEDGNVHLLDIRNGTPRRLYPTGRSIWSAPVILEGRVFTTNTAGHARAIDLYSREIPFEKAVHAWWWQFFLWRIAPPPPRPRGAIWLFTRTGEAFLGNLAAAHGMLYFGSVRDSHGGSVYALDQDTGELVWEFNAHASVSGSPAILGETVYITDGNGVVHGLNARTGVEVWRFSVDGVVNGGPVYSNGTLYVTTRGGFIYAIR